MQKCEHQHQSTWWFCQKNKMNKAVAQKLQSSRIVWICVPSCHPPVEALALRYWHDGGEGGGLLSPAHTSHTYNIVYPPYPTHSPPCLSEGTASLQNMGTGKGFKHIYIYLNLLFHIWKSINWEGATRSGVWKLPKNISPSWWWRIFYKCFASIQTSTINDVVGTQLT